MTSIPPSFTVPWQLRADSYIINPRRHIYVPIKLDEEYALHKAVVNKVQKTTEEVILNFYGDNAKKLYKYPLKMCFVSDEKAIFAEIIEKLTSISEEVFTKRLKSFLFISITISYVSEIIGHSETEREKVCNVMDFKFETPIKEQVKVKGTKRKSSREPSSAAKQMLHEHIPGDNKEDNDKVVSKEYCKIIDKNPKKTLEEDNIEETENDEEKHRKNTNIGNISVNGKEPSKPLTNTDSVLQQEAAEYILINDAGINEFSTVGSKTVIPEVGNPKYNSQIFEEQYSDSALKKLNRPPVIDENVQNLDTSEEGEIQIHSSDDSDLMDDFESDTVKNHVASKKIILKSFEIQDFNKKLGKTNLVKYPAADKLEYNLSTFGVSEGYVLMLDKFKSCYASKFLFDVTMLADLISQSDFQDLAHGFLRVEDMIKTLSILKTVTIRDKIHLAMKLLFDENFLVTCDSTVSMVGDNLSERNKFGAGGIFQKKVVTETTRPFQNTSKITEFIGSKNLEIVNTSEYTTTTSSYRSIFPNNENTIDNEKCLKTSSSAVNKDTFSIGTKKNRNSVLAREVRKRNSSSSTYDETLTDLNPKSSSKLSKKSEFVESTVSDSDNYPPTTQEKNNWLTNSASQAMKVKGRFPKKNENQRDYDRQTVFGKSNSKNTTTESPKNKKMLQTNRSKPTLTCSVSGDGWFSDVKHNEMEKTIRTRVAMTFFEDHVNQLLQRLNNNCMRSWNGGESVLEYMLRVNNALTELCKEEMELKMMFLSYEHYCYIVLQRYPNSIPKKDHLPHVCSWGHEEALVLSRNAFYEHVKEFHLIGVEEITCQLCSRKQKKFKNIRAFKAHMKNKHKGEAPPAWCIPKKLINKKFKKIKNNGDRDFRFMSKDDRINFENGDFDDINQTKYTIQSLKKQSTLLKCLIPTILEDDEIDGEEVEEEYDEEDEENEDNDMESENEGEEDTDDED